MMNTLRFLITYINIFSFMFFLASCQIISSDAMTDLPATQALPWPQQQMIAQQYASNLSTENYPLSVRSIVKNNMVVSTTITFATPVQGTIRVSYDPRTVDKVVHIEEDKEAIGFWFNDTTRKQYREAFQTAVVGPEEAYLRFKEEDLQHSRINTKEITVFMRLYLDRGPSNKDFPVWHVSYIDMEQGGGFQAWLDAKTKETVRTKSK